WRPKRRRAAARGPKPRPRHERRRDDSQELGGTPSSGSRTLLGGFRAPDVGRGAGLPAALVRADVAVHREDARLDALEQLPHRQTGWERELAVQGEDPEEVVVDAVPRRGKGAAV